MPGLGSGTSSQREARSGRGLDQGEHARHPVSAAPGRAACQGSRPWVLGPVDDRILHHADALDLAPGAVAGLQEDRRIAEDADARGRAGGDEVAGLERDVPRDEARPARARRGSCRRCCRPASGPACRRPGPSPGSASCGARGRPRGSISSGADEDRPDRQERVRALGAQPLAVALLALAQGRGVALPVAGADVVDDDVAGDVVERVRRATRRRVTLPMTTPSSTSRSSARVPSGRTIGSPSPTIALANLANSIGRSGAARPPSLAWSRS